MNMTDIGLKCLGYLLVDGFGEVNKSWQKIFCQPSVKTGCDIAYVIEVTKEIFFVEDDIPVVEARYFAEVTLEKDGRSFHIAYDYTWSVSQVEAHVRELIDSGMAEQLCVGKDGDVNE